MSKQIKQIKEAGGSISESQGSRREAVLISTGWGSSGYYSRDLLERDGPKVFPVGTHMYVDHPTRSEEAERPERTVKDLAGRVASTPRMMGDQLVADIEVFPVWRPVIEAAADDIGLSIRANGEFSEGEIGGRKGPIITSLTEGLSVDFVTHAGRGGKIGKLIESARKGEFEEARNAGNWLEARIHREFTSVADSLFGDGHLTREERIGLSSAIGDALESFNSTVKERLPGLYDRDPFADPDESTVQVNEAVGSDRATQQEGNNMSDEKRLSELEESVRGLTTKVEETEKSLTTEKARADRAEDALMQRDARDIVREATVKVDGKDEPVSVYDGLPPRAVERAVGAALAESIPTTEDGKIDRERLVERAVKAARDERDYLAENASPVKGAGNTDDNTSTVSDKQLTESFQRLGMSEKAAGIAAEGR